MALPGTLLVYNYKGAAHPINLDGDKTSRYSRSDTDVLSLTDVCCNKIVMDATTTEQAIQSVPTELWYSLMRAAVHGARDRAIEVLISHWPWDILSLHKFAPCLFDQIKVLYCDSYRNERMRKGIKYTTCLAHIFVESLKKRSPTKLKTLDLSGYPTAEVIVNYMSSHVLLVYNEVRQKEIISAYNAVTKHMPAHQRKQFQVDSTLPDETYVVTMDAFLQTTDTHMELCKALRMSHKPQCHFKLCLNKLDIMCLGLPRTAVLLEEIDPEYLTALCLQYNGLCNSTLSILVPSIQRLKQLQALDISCNSINLGSEGSQEKATEYMFTMLSSLPNLRRLDISSNRTKSKLSRVLSGIPKPLEYLKMCGCGLTESDIRYLKNSHHAKSLRELDISGNDLSRLLPHMLDMLSAMQNTLCILELEECNLSSQGMYEFFQCISQFSCLQFLNLSGNKQLTASIVENALISLVQLPCLQAVRLSYPSDCLSLGSLEGNEDELVEYSQSIRSKVEQLCSKLGRPALKIMFMV